MDFDGIKVKVLIQHYLILVNKSDHLMDPQH